MQIARNFQSINVLWKSVDGLIKSIRFGYTASLHLKFDWNILGVDYNHYRGRSHHSCEVLTSKSDNQSDRPNRHHFRSGERSFVSENEKWHRLRLRETLLSIYIYHLDGNFSKHYILGSSRGSPIEPKSTCCLTIPIRDDIAGTKSPYLKTVTMNQYF